MTEGIEYSDRYGGRAPSWLRGCFRCEAMGCYPEPPVEAVNADGTIDISSPLDWQFVVCPTCHGTRHCSWRETARRIPRWLVNGVRFAYGQWRVPFNAEAGRWANVRKALYVAYVIDLKALRH